MAGRILCKQRLPPILSLLLLGVATIPETSQQRHDGSDLVSILLHIDCVTTTLTFPKSITLGQSFLHYIPHTPCNCCNLGVYACETTNHGAA